MLHHTQRVVTAEQRLPIGNGWVSTRVIIGQLHLVGENMVYHIFASQKSDSCSLISPFGRFSQCLHDAACDFEASIRLHWKILFQYTNRSQNMLASYKKYIIIIFFTNIIFNKFHKWLLNDLSHLIMIFTENGELLVNALSLIPSFES